MKRLIIAIDCDDVLLDSTEFIVKKYNDNYDTSVKIENAHLSGNTEWGSDRDEVHRRIDMIQLSDEYGELKPSTKVMQIIQQLAKDHELHLVTARSEAVMDVTKRMLDTYFAGCFKTIEHVGYKRSKGEVCRAIAADVLVDDNVKHLQDAGECGVVNLLWFGDYKWQNYQESPLGVVRSGDWVAVKREVDRIARG